MKIDLRRNKNMTYQIKYTCGCEMVVSGKKCVLRDSAGHTLATGTHRIVMRQVLAMGLTMVG